MTQVLEPVVWSLTRTSPKPNIFESRANVIVPNGSPNSSSYNYATFYGINLPQIHVMRVVLVLKGTGRGLESSFESWPETQMSSSHGLHLDILSEPLELCEPVGFVFFKIILHLLQGFPSSSDGKASSCNAGDAGLIPGSGRSLGEGNGNLLQYSCLENFMDSGA